VCGLFDSRWAKPGVRCGQVGDLQANLDNMKMSIIKIDIEIDSDA
jgi:hypothetical protein